MLAYPLIRLSYMCRVCLPGLTAPSLRKDPPIIARDFAARPFNMEAHQTHHIPASPRRVNALLE